MTKQIWICDYCGAQYSCELDALKCESIHPKDYSHIKIEFVCYCDNKTNGPRNCPSRIKIRFGEDRNEFAFYKLEYIGPKGV